jgi:hypothetical protein
LTTECYSIDHLVKREGGMESSETQVARGAERRMTDRRVNPERRFGERRSTDRSSAGRRVEFVPDRREQERRILDRRAFSPA